MREWREFIDCQPSEQKSNVSVYERLDCLPSADFTNSASLGDNASKDSHLTNSAIISSESQTRCILAKIQNVKAIHDFNNIMSNKQNYMRAMSERPDGPIFSKK